jgi:hypothetical protein
VPISKIISYLAIHDLLERLVNGLQADLTQSIFDTRCPTPAPISGQVGVVVGNVSSLRRVAPIQRRLQSCRFERGCNDGLGFVEDHPQMVLAAEALGVDLVDIFRAGRPGCKPAVFGDYLAMPSPTIFCAKTGPGTRSIGTR